MKFNSVRIYLLIFTFFISFTGITHAGKKDQRYGDVTVDQVRTIYDGDTFYADIHGWPDIIGKSIGIRINGIDTPEIRTKCKQEKVLGRQAKQFAVEKLRTAKTVTLRNLQRGKYFRIVADVYVDDNNLGELLMQAGHAKPYDGKSKKRKWCN